MTGVYPVKLYITFRVTVPDQNKPAGFAENRSIYNDLHA